MNIVKDRFAHIDKDGVRIHTKVRTQQDDQNRVAVFLSPNQGPQHVYAAEEITLIPTSASCSHPVCYGKATRKRLTLLWEQQESVNV